MVTLIAAIFVFGILVTVHEFGHFAMAKLTGMRVDEFAIGFGPTLWKKKHGETLYAIRAIPLGGFNRIAGMDEVVEKMGNKEAQSADDQIDEIDDLGDRAYYKRPVWARMLVIVAGSFMNLILPFFIFFGIFFFSGVATPSTEPVIGAVISERPAALAGLQENDRILSIDGNEVKEWADIPKYIQASEGKPLKIAYQRGEEVKNTTLIPEEEPQTKRIVVGILGSAELYQPTFLEAAELSAKKIYYVLASMIGALLQMIQGSADTAQLSGPIGVAQMAGEVAQRGILPLLNFTAFISLNLGLVNMLPVPALDGGHFVMLVLEGLRGKPLGAKMMYYIQATGVVLLLSLMLFTIFNDLAK